MQYVFMTYGERSAGWLRLKVRPGLGSRGAGQGASGAELPVRVESPHASAQLAQRKKPRMKVLHAPYAYTTPGKKLNVSPVPPVPTPCALRFTAATAL